MSDQEKYYHPTSEELIIGLSYKIISDGSEWVIQEVKDIVTAQDYLWKDDLIVKYLDRSDMESLGWTQVPDQHSAAIIHKIETGETIEGIQFKKDLHRIVLYEDHSVHIFNENDPENSSTLFVGMIRNKSELGKILSMIDA